MSGGGTAALPGAARPFLGFAARLRANGFAVSPDRTEGFLAAIGLLGPRALEDVRRAGHAMFGPGPERRAEFDALFDAHFLGRSIAAPAAADEDETEVREDRDGAADPLEPEAEEAGGAEATMAETLTARGLSGGGDEAALARFARRAPARLPRLKSRRLRRARRGAALDMRRALRRALARDGELVELPRRARASRQRRILLLLDVSGSMRAGLDARLRLAHALVQAGERVEVFTLGTRLTRITRPLALRDRGRALARAAGLVADWEGGTRIGAALEALLAVPRFAGFVRGAAVVVVSDGLERDRPEAMVAAVARLSRLAWRVDWLSPLAADPAFEPRTAALAGAAPYLDRIGDGGSTEAIVAGLLDLAEGR
ncbi:MAG: VWA domain-containing protein [Pseudomonadota bacterium]